MSKIFISYNRQNEAIVRTLVTTLLERFIKKPRQR